VKRPGRFLLATIVALLALPVGTAAAANRMPIGFFDDVSFRYSADRDQNLSDAAATGASVIHTSVSWPAIAPTKPAVPSDGDDPAYQLGNLDDLVFQSGLYGMRVMIDITGTPKWANGNATPNHMPKKLSDLTTFAKMLATRYDGRHGHGSVGLYAVWNEPNLQLFLTPQYSGTKIVGPANYAKLYQAAYAGIKAGNPLAQVAIGETSARGRDKPLATASASVAPGTFARLLSQVKGLKFDAWAHHPYPTAPNLPPLQKVRYPNVTLSTLPQFEKDLGKWFHRTVPIWITEYGHETKPGEPKGVSTATQAAYAKQALNVAKADPNIQMFIWFTFRDSSGNPWQSGLEGTSGAPKPAYAVFGAIGRATDGQSVTVKAGKAPKIRIFLPFLGHYSPPGTQVGIYYTVYDGTKIVARATPTAALGLDESATFTPAFTPAKGHKYTIVAVGSEENGHTETRTTYVTVS
jgi:Cellulase (glycosyl hydrolase family 5)